MRYANERASVGKMGKRGATQILVLILFHIYPGLQKSKKKKHAYHAKATFLCNVAIQTKRSDFYDGVRACNVHDMYILVHVCPIANALVDFPDLYSQGSDCQLSHIW